MLFNMEMAVSGDILTITVDLSHPGRPSKNKYAQQRNQVLASTNGSKNLIGEDGKFRPEIINASIYRPPDDD